MTHSNSQRTTLPASAIAASKWHLITPLAFTLFALLNACGTAPQQSEKPEEVTSATAEQLITRELSLQLDRPVALHIDAQSNHENWTFWVGYPLNLDGSRIDISTTPFSADYAEGFFDDGFMALSKSSEGGDHSELIHLDYGATDAPFIDWAEQHKLPLCVFSTQNPCE